MSEQMHGGTAHRV